VICNAKTMLSLAVRQNLTDARTLLMTSEKENSNFSVLSLIRSNSIRTRIDSTFKIKIN
jgi:hypothetical protein